MHKEDLEQIVDIGRSKGKSILSLVVDDGPDWSLKSLTTFIALGQLWKEKALDALLVMTYAPGLSKYNPIEWQWAPRSRDLSGIILPVCLPGDSEPPAKQTDLIIEQREEKQKAVHKAAAQQLCQIWNGKSYDRPSSGGYGHTCA